MTKRSARPRATTGPRPSSTYRAYGVAVPHEPVATPPPNVAGLWAMERRRCPVRTGVSAFVNASPCNVSRSMPCVSSSPTICGAASIRAAKAFASSKRSSKSMSLHQNPREGVGLDRGLDGGIVPAGRGRQGVLLDHVVRAGRQAAVLLVGQQRDRVPHVFRNRRSRPIRPLRRDLDRANPFAGGALHAVADALDRGKGVLPVL